MNFENKILGVDEFSLCHYLNGTSIAFKYAQLNATQSSIWKSFERNQFCFCRM